MGYSVALSANPELLQHPGPVGFPMTLPASQDRPVFLRVAFDTGQGAMLRPTLFEHFIGISVADYTILLRNVVWIDYFEGLMGEVARQAVSSSHLTGVGLVALHAFRNIFVVRMVTGRAIELRVMRYVCLYLSIDFRMTGSTSPLQVAGRRNAQRSVGLAVARGTL